MRQGGKTKMKAILTVLLTGLIACMAFGYEGDIVFQGGHGAKALGMGGAFTALADDGSAALWNPSGLVHKQNAWLGGSTANLFELVGHQYVAGGFTLEGYALAAGWANATFERYTASMFMGTVAAHLAEIAAVGVNVKYIMEGYDEDLGTGIGFDIGLGMHLTDDITLGLMARDVGGLTVVEGETIPGAYQVGMAAHLLEGALTLSADVGIVGGDFDLRTGLNVMLIENLSIRGGLVLPDMDFGHAQFSLGAGVMFAGLSIDAAYLLREDLGNTLVLSASFNFGELFPPEEEVGVE